METNAINYTCKCGRTWKYTYYVEIDGTIVYLSRIAVRGTLNDALCTCGKVAEGNLETAMLGYTNVKVRFMTPAQGTQCYSEPVLEQRYEELVQHFIAQASGFISWKHLEELEERAATIAERGLTAALWDALSAEQQAETLSRQP